MTDAMLAWKNWVRTTKDPAATWEDRMTAFNQYTQCCNHLAKARPVRKQDWNRQSSWLELKDRIVEILEGWIDRIRSWFQTGRTPSKTELDQFEREVAGAMEEQFESLADDVYRDGMEDAARDIDGFTPQFGGRHERALRVLTERSTVPETFRSLSSEAGNVLVDELQEAFASGQQRIDAVVNAVTQRFGEEIFPAAETVARSEAWKVWQQSKYETYREAEERRGEPVLVEFMRDLGPTPRGNPQCDVCTEIINRTRGGVTLEELNDIIVEVSTDPEYGGSPSWDPMRDSDIGLPHPNCMAGEMEVLTSEGWKRFDGCRGDETVLTLNPETGEREWQDPTAWIEREATQRIHQHVDDPYFAVTPDHDMWVFQWGGQAPYKEYGHGYGKTPLVELLARDSFQVLRLGDPMTFSVYGPWVETKNIVARDPREGEKVYCFTVPNGTLLVRMNGGTPFWIGNCRHTVSRVQE